jgi:hypothetical protein
MASNLYANIILYGDLEVLLIFEQQFKRFFLVELHDLVIYIDTTVNYPHCNIHISYI